MSTILPQTAFDAPVTPAVGPRGLSAAELDAIVKAASELFSTTVVPELEEDPEIDDRYYLLKMKVVRDVDEVARLRKDWFELLRQLAPKHYHAFRLAVDYSP
jgi:hypothetical protein